MATAFAAAEEETMCGEEEEEGGGVVEGAGEVVVGGAEEEVVDIFFRIVFGNKSPRRRGRGSPRRGVQILFKHFDRGTMDHQLQKRIDEWAGRVRKIRG